MREDLQVEQTYDYDVAVTFAGEDRAFVQAVVDQVTGAGYKVFYDQDEQITLWGEELTEYLPKIYEERARYAVMFVSRHYAAKQWTRLERRSVLIRALDQPTPYLLPVRLDSTQLDGVRPTIGYVDGLTLGSAGVAAAIQEKLGSVQVEGHGGFNGYVPRNEHEATVLIGERPDAWEYLLFSYALVRGVEQLHERYLDHCMEFARPANFVARDQVADVVQREVAYVRGIIRNFSSVLSDSTQELTFGAAGEPGDADRIVHVASRYTLVYEQFFDWADRLRGYTTATDAAYDVFRSLANYAQQPVERMRSFAYEFRDIADTISAQLLAGESMHLELRLPLEVAPEASARFDQALDVFKRS